jgi:hypothetical protein
MLHTGLPGKQHTPPPPPLLLLLLLVFHSKTQHASPWKLSGHATRTAAAAATATAAGIIAAAAAAFELSP